jgi:hypothetical protein
MNFDVLCFAGTQSEKTVTQGVLRLGLVASDGSHSEFELDDFSGGFRIFTDNNRCKYLETINKKGTRKTTPIPDRLLMERPAREGGSIYDAIPVRDCEARPSSSNPNH